MQVIPKALRQLGDAFEPDYLAYAALTGKIEKELCDSLAWCLRRASGDSEIKLVREWKPPNGKRRTDLAVLVGSQELPRALIEAKQWRSFDFASWSGKGTEGRKNILQKTLEDKRKLEEAKQCVKTGCMLYLLSFCVHCDPVLPKAQEAHKGEIKYFEEMIRFGKIEKSQINDGFEQLRNRWGYLPIGTHGEIEAGTALGWNVTVLYWLLDAS